MNTWPAFLTCDIGEGNRTQLGCPRTRHSTCPRYALRKYPYKISRCIPSMPKRRIHAVFHKNSKHFKLIKNVLHTTLLCFSSSVYGQRFLQTPAPFIPSLLLRWVKGSTRFVKCCTRICSEWQDLPRKLLLNSPSDRSPL